MQPNPLPMPRRLETVQDVVNWFWTLDRGTAEHHKGERRIHDLFCLRFGKQRIGECLPCQLAEFVDAMPNLSAENTRRHWFTVIRTPFNAAYRRDLIPLNPFLEKQLPKGDFARDADVDNAPEKPPNLLPLPGKQTNGQTVRMFDPERFPEPKKQKRYAYKLPNYLRSEEEAALLGQCLRDIEEARYAGQYRRAHRDFLMVAIGLGVGPRASELTGFEIGDVDLIRKTLTVRQGKGNKDRVLPLPADLVEPLQKWIGNRKTGFLFQGPDQERLARQTFQIRLKALGRKAGIARRVHPHALRHTFACRLLHNGVDIETVRQLLGHTNIATTGLYLHTDAERTREAVDSSPPAPAVPPNGHPKPKADPSKSIRDILLELLPPSAPGLSMDEIQRRWPVKTFPQWNRLLAEVRNMLKSGELLRDGIGKRGSPYRFWKKGG